MRSFFKIFFASLLALIVFVFIGVLIVIGMVASATSGDKPEVGNKAVLLLDLTKEYKEQKADDAFNIIRGNADENVPGLYDVVRMIEYAKSDSSVKGIYIKAEDNANGFAGSEELRNALIDFKKSHKFVIAFGDVISQKAYYVASAADKIYCNPKGTVDWHGLATTLLFLKGALDKLEIEPQIFYAGKFKSATEPLRAYEMTEPNKLQTSVYLNDLYSHILLAARDKSKLDTAKLHELANSGAIQTATEAAQYHLIDGVKYDDEVKNEIIQNIRIEPTAKINFISLGKYAKAVDFTASSGSKIAIIYAEGELNDGKGKDGEIGSDLYRNLIRKARLDKNIKAIVFRVNSPGGSALASEEIWREITIAKKAKPVIVSFGDVAASGGYYISCNADSIFAQPNTITGSIGVFGIIPNTKKFMNNKLGITFDGVKTGPFADMPSTIRPLNTAEKQFIQNTIDTIYTAFKGRVAEGRKLSMQIVDSIAQGRVWTGERALKLGLVDRLGNINDAVNCAARMAKLNDFQLKEYPEQKGVLEKFLNNYSNEVKVKTIKEEIGEEQYSILQQLKNIRKMVAVPQTRLPFELNIR
ncbi:signal peptide peptidase SppA [Segetibacter aerophilus]|uniref:Signal peptide peptidase SppA n=1 Tax=Segetibacter aerophilus TaxID=670293 RepID=A0A512BAG2_9BACT|nr:signal peptide peptidase SppA [Segetibacter aerophilus]GEO08951.1 signal peptide peptidase SppA [Segetibacter aerophilus]